MENETFRSRVVTLMNRSRKALRLYSNVGKLQVESQEHTEAQAREWKNITSELLKDLTASLENGGGHKQLVSDIYFLRDKYSSQWRSLEAELHVKQRELVLSAEHGDFVKTSNLSTDLVLLKARMQAAQAAHHELQDVIARSKVAQPTIELAPSDVVPGEVAAPEPQRKTSSLLAGAAGVARVIPLRKLL